MKLTILALCALTLTAAAAERYAYCPGGELPAQHILTDPRGRSIRGTLYGATATDERLAKDDLYPVVVTNPYDPETHVATGQTAALEAGEYRVTYTLRTVAEHQAAQLAAKAAESAAQLRQIIAVWDGIDAVYRIGEPPATVTEAIAVLQAKRRELSTAAAGNTAKLGPLTEFQGQVQLLVFLLGDLANAQTVWQLRPYVPPTSTTR